MPLHKNRFLHAILPKKKTNATDNDQNPSKAVKRAASLPASHRGQQGQTAVSRGGGGGGVFFFSLSLLPSLALHLRVHFGRRADDDGMATCGHALPTDRANQDVVG